MIDRQRLNLPAELEVTSVIGAGNFGAVYACRYTGQDVLMRSFSDNNNGMVAVKVLAEPDVNEDRVLNLLQSQNFSGAPLTATVGNMRAMEMVTYKGSPTSLEKFLRDRAPYIDDDAPTLEGADLSKTINGLFKQVIVKQNELHDAGVLHLDTSARNFLISADKNGGLELKIIDFGLSQTTLMPAYKQAYKGTSAPLNIIDQGAYNGYASIRTDIFARKMAMIEIIALATGLSALPDPVLNPDDLTEQEKAILADPKNKAGNKNALIRQGSETKNDEYFLQRVYDAVYQHAKSNLSPAVFVEIDKALTGFENYLTKMPGNSKEINNMEDVRAIRRADYKLFDDSAKYFQAYSNSADTKNATVKMSVSSAESAPKPAAVPIATVAAKQPTSSIFARFINFAKKTFTRQPNIPKSKLAVGGLSSNREEADSPAPVIIASNFQSQKGRPTATTAPPSNSGTLTKYGVMPSVDDLKKSKGTLPKPPRSHVSIDGATPGYGRITLPGESANTLKKENDKVAKVDSRYASIPGATADGYVPGNPEKGYGSIPQPLRGGYCDLPKPLNEPSENSSRYEKLPESAFKTVESNYVQIPEIDPSSIKPDPSEEVRKILADNEYLDKDQTSGHSQYGSIPKGESKSQEVEIENGNENKEADLKPNSNVDDVVDLQQNNNAAQILEIAKQLQAERLAENKATAPDVVNTTQMLMNTFKKTEPQPNEVKQKEESDLFQKIQDDKKAMLKERKAELKEARVAAREQAPEEVKVAPAQADYSHRSRGRPSARGGRHQHESTFESKTSLFLTAVNDNKPMNYVAGFAKGELKLQQEVYGRNPKAQAHKEFHALLKDVINGKCDSVTDIKKRIQEIREDRRERSRERHQEEVREPPKRRP